MAHNPFNQELSNLFSLTTGDIANDLLTAENVRKIAIHGFVKQRLVEKNISLHSNTKTKKLKSLEPMYATEITVENQRSVTLKADRSFSTSGYSYGNWTRC